MIHFVLKVFISAILIAGISEIARRNLFLSAILASLPITSVLAFIWLYRQESDALLVADLSMQIFWLVIPSLVLFAMLTWLIRHGFEFWPSLTISLFTTVAAYFTLVYIARYFAYKI